jgi:hypothetical protein
MGWPIYQNLSTRYLNNYYAFRARIGLYAGFAWRPMMPN